MVERRDPFQTTADVFVKLDPLTVRVKPLVPTVAELGDKLLTRGSLAKAGEQATHVRVRMPSRARIALWRSGEIFTASPRTHRW